MPLLGRLVVTPFRGARSNPMSESKTFKSVIEAAGRGGAYVRVPFDVEKVYGRKRVKVVATFNGAAYRGSIVRVGGPDHILPILRAIRKKIGKDVGDTVKVTVREDTEPRVVVPPKDFASALKASPRAAAFFRNLSYTHQREYVKWIEDAKRLQTRASRIERSVEMLLREQRSI